MKKTITINGQKTKVNEEVTAVNKVSNGNIDTWDLLIKVEGKEYNGLYQAITTWNKKTKVPSCKFICIKTGESFKDNQKKMLEHLLN